ncbi:MAG TPA: folylpolyglutamate synthase/dihydrofolate synthase family protein, partial [Nitrospiraceae bacterium]|nr:folylpolyglutamate synthase/dihydrofolate synthase family protein [Nitrospiraceae bacterium]
MAFSYSSSLKFLYGLQKHGIKLGLETITGMLAKLGRPQDRYRTVHIGGTNGKGSTAVMTAAILQAAGYRVGLYTSPHLTDFRERIRVNDDPIPEDSVTELAERLQDAAGVSLRPTFFEFTTALALQFFADSQVEIVVLEVGMGGRFDATNVVVPLVSVITNVALDHEEYLGHTLGAIAFEKAGIIKRGVPVVVGRLEPEAAEVIQRIVSEQTAPLYRLNVDFLAEGTIRERFRYQGLRGAYGNLSCPLDGAHQLDNAACALALLELASEKGIRVSEESVRAGLRSVYWEGRLEVVDHHPTLLLDGAHNPAAAKVVATYLAAYRRDHPRSRILLVIGMMRDKDREGFFRAILPTVDEVIVTQANMARAATVEELSSSLGEQSDSLHVASHPADALALARRLASPEDLICVTGSLMLVGEVKALLRGC